MGMGVSDPAGSELPRVVRAGAGEVLGPPDLAQDRFLIDGRDTGGRVAVVEHLLTANVLAGPLHRHTLEDEFSYVLAGRVGALLGDQQVVVEAGDLLFKPRGQWHTFWNAGDEPARILEIISPAGLEDLFRRFGDAGYPEPEDLVRMAAEFGAEIDLDGTMAVVDRYGLRF
jgi:mannose-6-phosphate isomerase-like protein (cupin superfamily)